MEVIEVKSWVLEKNKPVRTTKVKNKTDFHLLRTVTTELEIQLQEKTPTSIKIEVITRAIGSKLLTGITYLERWEIFANKEGDNQIAVRISTQILWRFKPPIVWKKIDGGL